MHADDARPQVEADSAAEQRGEGGGCRVPGTVLLCACDRTAPCYVCRRAGGVPVHGRTPSEWPLLRRKLQLI
jgi:hypothetical protein